MSTRAQLRRERGHLKSMLPTWREKLRVEARRSGRG
jgi:hypothetical protein